ncbi:DUF4199 domain-containing protein [Aquimarina algiphila]|uniref:DUF4199 domain-containing protein n=1 Tax=Aquimarina algiphila TaxID=2047982 RepID=UPI00232F0288|nr:DUF4199 domain-containing protein [Aquimarina algiphila]
MENNKAPTKKIIIKYGVLFGIIQVTYSIIRYLTGYTVSVSGNLFLIPIELSIHIGMVSYGIHSFKLSNNHFLKLGQALKVGFSIALIGAGIQILWDIFFLKVMSPETMYQLINLNDQFNDRTAISEPIERDSIMSRENNLLLLRTLITLVGNSTLGFLISLIAGSIMMKKKRATNHK